MAATAAQAARDEGCLGISEAAAAAGLSPDTLRWYEREGLLPPVERDPVQGRRRYSARDVALLETLARLRRTGMPVREMREFTRLAAGGAATHPGRLALLARHRERIVARQAGLQAGLAVLDEKCGHYRYLIEHGLDCAGEPAPAAGQR